MGTNIGFTGSRKGMTVKQILVLTDLFKELKPSTFHHGDCIGADQYAHSAAINQGLIVVVHPPVNPKARAWCKPGWYGGHILLPKEYIERNHDIVDACDILIATPRSDQEEQRSGTWATVRYARKVGKEIFIVCPDGSIGDGK